MLVERSGKTRSVQDKVADNPEESNRVMGMVRNAMAGQKIQAIGKEIDDALRLWLKEGLYCDNKSQVHEGGTVC